MLIDTGLRLQRHIDINVPIDIARFMLAALEHLPNPGLEFGAYLQGELNLPELRLDVVPDKIYVPRQVTSRSHIQFDEDPPGPEWNVVIHRHPDGVRAFSRTDEASINEEFLASILFIPPSDFPAAVVNVPVGDGVRLQVGGNVRLAGGAIDSRAIEQIRASVTQYSVPAGAATPSGEGFVRRLDPVDAQDLINEMGFSRAGGRDGGSVRSGTAIHRRLPTAPGKTPK